MSMRTVGMENKDKNRKKITKKALQAAAYMIYYPTEIFKSGTVMPTRWTV